MYKHRNLALRLLITRHEILHGMFIADKFWNCSFNPSCFVGRSNGASWIGILGWEEILYLFMRMFTKNIYTYNKAVLCFFQMEIDTVQVHFVY